METMTFTILYGSKTEFADADLHYVPHNPEGLQVLQDASGSEALFL
jgi:hypothetical protein